MPISLMMWLSRSDGRVNCDDVCDVFMGRVGKIVRKGLTLCELELGMACKFMVCMINFSPMDTVSEKRRRATLRKTDVADHFGSDSAAARALDITRQYFRALPDPLPDQWAALAEVMSGGKLRAFPRRIPAKPGSVRRAPRAATAPPSQVPRSDEAEPAAFAGQDFALQEVVGGNQVAPPALAIEFGHDAGADIDVHKTPHE
jgi:hypothetical protein